MKSFLGFWISFGLALALGFAMGAAIGPPPEVHHWYLLSIPAALPADTPSSAVDHGC